MKKSAVITLLALVLTGLVQAEPSSDRFGSLKGKIDALLSPRLKPGTLPEKPANPFQFTLPGSTIIPVTPDPAKPVPATLADDDQILAFGVARLRISGLVLRGGVSHLLINSATYKESDLIPVRASGDTVYYIRLIRIFEGEATFGYNNATLVIPLPN